MKDLRTAVIEALEEMREADKSFDHGALFREAIETLEAVLGSDMLAQTPLKLCPCCGARGYTLVEGVGFKIKCTDTECGIETPVKEQRHRAIALWNRRDVVPDESIAYFNAPADLDDGTLQLVKKFAGALADQLTQAKHKYGFTDEWCTMDADACRVQLKVHLEKGNPLDVAAYCAFLWWHHGTLCDGAQIQPWRAISDLVMTIRTARSNEDADVQHALDYVIAAVGNESTKLAVAIASEYAQAYEQAVDQVAQDIWLSIQTYGIPDIALIDVGGRLI